MDDLHEHAAGEILFGCLGGGSVVLIVLRRHGELDVNLAVRLAGDLKGDLVKVGALGGLADLAAAVVKHALLRAAGKRGEGHVVEFNVSGGILLADQTGVLGGFLKHILKVVLLKGDRGAGGAGVFDVVAVQRDLELAGGGNIVLVNADHIERHVAVVKVGKLERVARARLVGFAPAGGGGQIVAVHAVLEGAGAYIDIPVFVIIGEIEFDVFAVLFAADGEVNVVPVGDDGDGQRAAKLLTIDLRDDVKLGVSEEACLRFKIEVGISVHQVFGA